MPGIFIFLIEVILISAAVLYYFLRKEKKAGRTLASLRHPYLSTFSYILLPLLYFVIVTVIYINFDFPTSKSFPYIIVQTFFLVLLISYPRLKRPKLTEKGVFFNNLIFSWVDFRSWERDGEYIYLNLRKPKFFQAKKLIFRVDLNTFNEIGAILDQYISAGVI